MEAQNQARSVVPVGKELMKVAGRAFEGLKEGSKGSDSAVGGAAWGTRACWADI